MLISDLSSDVCSSDLEEEDVELTLGANEEGLSERSILWGYSGSSVLPGGNFNVLSALASVLLNEGEAGRDRYFAILDEHFSQERDPNVWKALLYRLGNAGGLAPQVVSEDRKSTRLNSSH